MLHEVLMALAGYEGGLFNNSRGSEFKNFLHPGERTLLERIQRIACHFKNLKDFIEENICQVGLQHNDDHDVNNDRNDDFETNSEIPSKLRKGLYLQAFCSTLSDVLDPYRKDIGALEEEVLNDPYLPLTRILVVAEKHATLLLFLNKIISQMKRENVHGFQILRFLYRHLSSGLPQLTHAIKRILHGCHVVLLKQLTSWLLYGQLTDTYKEFLIQQAEESPLNLSLQTFKSEFYKESEVGSDVKSQESGLKYVLHGSEMKTGVHGSDMSHYPEFSEYVIDFDVLPPYIAASVACKILFVGRTVLMFGNNPLDVSDASSSKSKLSMWSGKEEEFFIKLQQLLLTDQLDEILFEKTINEIHSCVTEHLWQLAVEEGKLFVQLKFMKDFFLLGRGELFLEFIKQATPLLSKPPCSTSNRDVNQAFQIAARNVLLNDEAALEKFYFSIPVKDKNKKDSQVSLIGWQLLSLKYKVSWPLHLLFGPEILENYNHLFGFLLRVTKVQHELNMVWSNQITEKSSAQMNRGSAVWQLRNNLVFLINNLQYYLQVDVLESQYMQLKATVFSTKDFQKVQQAHTIFLTNIISQTFILMGTDKPDHRKLHPVPSDKTVGFKANPVHRSLISFLSLCETFCMKVTSWQYPPSIEDESELQRMNEEFMTQLKFLLQLLSSLRSQPCGTHLSQLLLRVDYNRWFSRLLSHCSTSVPLTFSSE